MPNNKFFIEADLGLDFISAGTTTRGLDCKQAVSNPPYHRLNIGNHMQDDPNSVFANRSFLQQQLQLPSSPCWLQQVHGSDVVEQPQHTTQESTQVPTQAAVADASFTYLKRTVLAIMTADCLPVVLASEEADWIATAHCGWRSLAAGILSKTLSTAPLKPNKIRAWFGPAIGANVFEVGEEVKIAFQKHLKTIISEDKIEACFKETSANKYLADLSNLAKFELQSQGVKWIKSSNLCSYSESEKFFSFRRDGETGRMATLAWIQ